MASPKIQIKRGTTTPIVSDFSQGELALNHNNNTLYAQSNSLTGGTALAASGTFTIGTPAAQTYLGVSGFAATMTTSVTKDTSGVAVGDILKGTNGVSPAVGAFPTTAQCIVISLDSNTQVTFWSSATPIAGVVTAVTKTSPLKWVGAEIENTLTSGTFNKLTTQAGIATYIGNTSLSLGGGTLTGPLSLKNGNSVGELSFYEGSGGANFIKLKAPSAVSNDTTLTLPDGPPSTAGYLLKSDTSGNLGWVAPTAATTIGATDDATFSTALPIVFIDGSTLKTTSSKLKFIPSTGVLTSTGFSATDATATTSLNATSLGVTGSTSFNLINAAATTVNFAGAATTLSIGAGSGTTTINNNTVITGNLTTTGTTVHNGNFTVAGTQTYLNTTVMTVTDKNIELGSIGTATGTTGGVATATFTFALITFPTQGTVARIGSTGSFGKITFSNTTSIPTGVRPGTRLNSSISVSTTPGYLGGGIITVTSITPTEIYYTAGSGVPVAGTTSGLLVTNDYISSTITLSNGSTTNMIVGSAVTATLSSGTLTTATVALIGSGSTFTIVNRAAISGSLTATAIATGASSDITADGGGFTIKGTTDKTFTWVSAANSTWPTGRFSMNQPLEVVQTCGSDPSANNSCLRLKSDATLDSDGTVSGHAVDTMIEFNNITSADGSTSTSTAWFGVDKSNRLKFQTSRNANVFSVDYEGKVEDCTIDCGQY